ncbi:lipopolysaccharide biosynthesis protein [Longimicrobium sp.]|uniref:lipopolysaccharide biosynthesis protein n=1 Tax=Longimicrobium sp. TaxID=2029185 RepID=UPI002ED9B279
MTEPPLPGRTLGARTLSAAQWRLGTSLVQGFLQFATGVLLARLLPPRDFGLVALALVVTGLATLVADLGLGPAIVQRRDLTGRHLRTAFTASLLFGLAITALVALLAPLAGVLLASPQLPAVLAVLSLLFVMGAFGVVPRALLQRDMRAVPLFTVSVVSYLVGYAVAVTALALAGFGVWSLVWGSLIQTGLESAMALAIVRPPVRPLLGRAELRDLLGYGAKASLNAVVNYFARNGDNAIVGRVLGPGALGLYNRAYGLMLLPLTHLGGATNAVLFPALAEVQSDLPRVRRGYLLAVQFTALVAAPVMAGMAVAAPHMVAALYGPRWEGMVPALQVLCAAGLFRAVYHLAGAVTSACGRLGEETRRQFVYAALVAAGGIAGTRWGVTGVAVGISIGIAYMYVAMSGLALRITGGTWGEFLGVQAPGVALGAVVGAAALGVRLALEALGAGHGAVFLGVLAACAAALPAGLYLLPARVRPAALFDRLAPNVGRLPRPLQFAMVRVLRLSPEGGRLP